MSNAIQDLQKYALRHNITFATSPEEIDDATQGEGLPWEDVEAFAGVPFHAMMSNNTPPAFVAGGKLYRIGEDDLGKYPGERYETSLDELETIANSIVGQ